MRSLTIRIANRLSSIMRKQFLFASSLFLSIFANAQSPKGSWYGKADVLVAGASSNYLTEFVLKQKGNEVEGIFGYYFKDSYQSFFVRGTYNRKSRVVTIKNLPMLFYAAETRNGIECPMNFEGTLMVSKAASTIKGSFYTEPKYKYTCPELRVTLQMDINEKNQDSVLSNTVAGKKFWKPQEEDFIVTNIAKNDTSIRTADVTVNHPASVQPQQAERLIAEFKERKNTYNKDLYVSSDSIRLSFYDNGDIDGDSISVFLNANPVLVKQEITSRALNLYLTLDKNREYNEISMFADNLGNFPPNTALMIISDGVTQHELYLSSSLTQNASVRIRRK
jgi:hypothetical protein